MSQPPGTEQAAIIENILNLTQTLTSNHIPNPNFTEPQVEENVKHIEDITNAILSRDRNDFNNDEGLYFLKNAWIDVSKHAVDIYRIYWNTMFTILREIRHIIEVFANFIKTFYPNDQDLINRLNMSIISKFPGGNLDNIDSQIRTSSDYFVISKLYSSVKDLPRIIVEELFLPIDNFSEVLLGEEMKTLEELKEIFSKYPVLRTRLLDQFQDYETNGVDKWQNVISSIDIDTNTNVKGLVNYENQILSIETVSKYKYGFVQFIQQIHTIEQKYGNILDVIQNPSLLETSSDLSPEQNKFLAKLVESSFSTKFNILESPQKASIIALANTYTESPSLIDFAKHFLITDDPEQFFKYLLRISGEQLSRYIRTNIPVFRDIRVLPDDIFIQNKNEILNSLLHDVPPSSLPNMQLLLLNFMIAGFIGSTGKALTPIDASYSVAMAIAAAKPELLSFLRCPRTVSYIIQHRLLPKHSFQQSLSLLRGDNTDKVKLAKVSTPRWALPDRFAIALDGITTDSSDIDSLLEAYTTFRKTQDAGDYDKLAQLYNKELGHTISSDAF